ncbi:MAG: DUF1643 domain-containing protein [Sphingomonadales bacterium]|nr:DUF1643 domain-containing protein [Sphingomonadales bacterium]MDE2567486.1 DUF1643 domain-containing protein [Sphingomonadales bacterium]
MEGGATFSPCGRYRYELIRRWQPGPSVLFVMLNPSRADAESDDPTIRRCSGFARRWGFGALTVANLFAFRTPSPIELKAAPDPVGADNDSTLQRLSRQADLTIAAWGNHGRFGGRSGQVAPWLAAPHCLQVTALGEPAHPLYLRSDCQPFQWEPGA